MDCREVTQRLSEFADGMLPEAAAAAIREHLNGCAACAEAYAAMSAIIAHMNRMETVAEPADFVRQVQARLEKQSHLKAALRRFFLPLRIKLPLELAGAAVAALLIFFFIGTGREPRLYEIIMLMNTQPGTADTAQKAPERGGKSEPAGKKSAGEETTVQEIVGALDGTVISVEYREDTGVPRAVVIELRANDYHTLQQKLQKIADIQQPLPRPPELGDEIIRVNIHFQYSDP